MEECSMTADATTKPRAPRPEKRATPHEENMRELSDARAQTVRGILERKGKARAGRS